MDLKLNGKLALVTGSTSGIGKAIAKRLLMEGARVVINEIDPKNVEKVAQELSEFGTTYCAAGDLSNMEGAQAVFDSVDAIGELDILVNNMGIYESIPFVDITDDRWMRMLNINVMSMVRMCRHYLPKMIARNSGRITLSASEVAIKPLPTFLHYCVSKTAVMGLGRGLAELTKGTKVTVNTILPGPTWTEGTAVYQTGVAEKNGMTIEEHITDYFDHFDPSSLVRRFVDVDEIATTVAYYCSDLSSATNGASIRVEGGLIKSI